MISSILKEINNIAQNNVKLFHIFLFVSMIAFVTGAAQSQKDIDSLLIKSEGLVYAPSAKGVVLNDFIFKEAKSITTKTDALLLQAEAYEVQIKYYEALQKIIEAKDFNANLKCAYCNASIYIHLSEIYRKIDLPTLANEALQYAETLLRDNRGSEFARLRILLLLEKSQIQDSSTELKLSSLKSAVVVFNENKKALNPGLSQKIAYYTGVFYLQQNELDKAKAMFNKLLASKSTNAITIYNVLAEQELGKIALKKGDEDEAINLLKKVINAKDFSPIVFRNNYELLANIYFDRKDMAQFAYYKELYIVKSGELAEIKNATKVLSTGFYEKEKQSELAQNNSEFITTFLIVLMLFVLILTAVGFYYFNLKKKYKNQRTTLNNKKLLEETIESMKTQYMEENAAVPFSVPEKAENAILEKLMAFEKSELFTDHELSLKSLAKQLDTNTKYLSEIINNQKNKNFKTYINELRINYIIYKLEHNPEYRNYKTSHLANEAGFTSRSSFTIVFKTITGLSPSVFIASLKESTKSDTE